MAEWIKVAALADCPVGQLKSVPAGGEQLVLANVDGNVYALLDRCSHEEYPLSDGDLEDTDLVCMYHGARFDVRTGKNKALPAIRPVRSFPVEIREGDVYVEV
ncbi:MAG: non-heme iron oxygenase ferredoxin subunit [Gemmatimonadetes bacterium]|jgi:3-phenylpropionate/trans-cinnamate dioxygenase ferredoxin subunit|nr:non-heme iron oxygenase ferredoxin subunit [Gemmatimonadota bacterium]